MPDYRLYTVHDGHIMRAPVEFEAASDEEAIEKAQQYGDGSTMELWQRARLVNALPGIGDDGPRWSSREPGGPPARSS